MKNKILVTDNISIEISKHKIEVFTFLPFAKPKYMDECTSESDVSFTISNYRELKTFWKFVENNKNNLFDMAGYEGEVEA